MAHSEAERKRDRASSRKEGLTMIQTRVETRDLIKKLAAKQNMTIPEFLTWAAERLAGALDEEIPETYKTERVMDSQLRKGHFDKIAQKQPKDTFCDHPTRKQWDKMEEDGSWEAWVEEYDKRNDRPFPGYEMAFENSART